MIWGLGYFEDEGASRGRQRPGQGTKMSACRYLSWAVGATLAEKMVSNQGVGCSLVCRALEERRAMGRSGKGTWLEGQQRTQSNPI